MSNNSSNNKNNNNLVVWENVVMQSYNALQSKTLCGPKIVQDVTIVQDILATTAERDITTFQLWHELLVNLGFVVFFHGTPHIHDIDCVHHRTK